MSFLFGGSAKTDRQNQLGSWNDLNSVFDFGSKTGENQITQGAAGLSSASDYFKALMSGDQAKMSQVLAPQISTIKGQQQQQVNTLSQFGNRSGGTNAQAQNDTEAAGKSIQQLFDMLGPEAAQEVAQISGQQEGLGTGVLGLGTQAEGTVGQQAGQARMFDTQQEAQTGSDIGGAIMSLLKMFPTATNPTAPSTSLGIDT